MTTSGWAREDSCTTDHESAGRGPGEIGVALVGHELALSVRGLEPGKETTINNR